jgi:hypothetical protein
VSDLALIDQFRESAHSVLNRCVGVDAVLVIEVDAVRGESLQGALNRGADICGTAVDMTRTTSRV